MDDTELQVKAFIDGDDEALITLCRRYDRPLRKVINAYLDPQVRRRVDDSDLIQMTWLSAAAKLRAAKRVPDIGLLPMVRNIAKEQVIDMHRAHRSAGIRNVYFEEALDIPDVSINGFFERLAEVQAGPRTSVERAERIRFVHNALQRISDEHREILLLRFLEQLKLEECAEVLGVTLAAAKSRQRRALVAFSREVRKDLSS